MSNINEFIKDKDFAGCGSIDECDIYNYRINLYAIDQWYTVKTPFGSVSYKINENLHTINFRIPVFYLNEVEYNYYYYIALFFGNEINQIYRTFHFLENINNCIFCEDVPIKINDNYFEYECTFNDEKYWGFWIGT